MSDETEHRVQVAIGIFTLAMLGCTYFYGIYAISVWIIALAVIGAILNAIESFK